MTGLTVTTKLTDLKTLFNDVKEIYFKSSEIKAADLGKAFTVDIEFPVLEEGVIPEMQKLLKSNLLQEVHG